MKFLDSPQRKESGFTLIELLVVIAIIGLLSSVIIASLNTARKKSRDARRLADLKQIQTALELYNSDNSLYPVQASVAALSSTSGTPDFGTTYLSTVPTDPNGSSTYYQYISSATGDTYCVGTLYYETTAPADTCGTPAASTLGTAATGRTIYGVGP